MKKSVGILLLSCSFVMHASGDVQAGKTKSTVCAACHGPTGISINPAWPHLAGQHARYLLKQLTDYQKGLDRASTVMGPMVAALSEQDKEDLAAYYEQQPLPKSITPQRFAKRGEQLYRGGDFEKHITACIACHGPNGTGNAQAGFPSLAGQQAAYTLQQLQQFKEGTRRNDLNGIMRDISARMSTEDMEAVAHYIAGLH